MMKIEKTSLLQEQKDLFTDGLITSVLHAVNQYGKKYNLECWTDFDLNKIVVFFMAYGEELFFRLEKKNQFLVEKMVNEILKNKNFGE